MQQTFSQHFTGTTHVTLHIAVQLFVKLKNFFFTRFATFKATSLESSSIDDFSYKSNFKIEKTFKVV